MIEEFHWPGFHSLALASSLLKPGAPHPAVNRLLHKAGIAALHMPGLQRLQIFSRDTQGPEDVDGFFQYFVDGQKGDNTAICFGKSDRDVARTCDSC